MTVQNSVLLTLLFKQLLNNTFNFELFDYFLIIWHKCSSPHEEYVSCIRHSTLTVRKFLENRKILIFFGNILLNLSPRCIK